MSLKQYLEEQAIMKVFLGGTCNDSTWRDELIPKLRIDYFNPVVDDWTPEGQGIELEERENSDFVLYVITPKMKGCYSIAEAVDDSNKRPGKTIFAFLLQDDAIFDDAQIKSLEAVGSLVQRNGGKWFRSLDEIAIYLNEV